MGVDLDLQSVRDYPDGTTAAHLLGYVLRDDSSANGETSFFDYRLPDYGGKVGIEAGFDSQLRGQAGEDSLIINSRGYRQTNNISDVPEPGHNVTLTVDLDIQRAAENAIVAHQGADARAAVVVMDVRSGDVLAMVSSPAMNPIYMSNSPAYLNDPKLQPQINRATYGNYAPGSIFKPIVGLAALENGLNPDEFYDVQPDPAEPNKGCIYVGQRKIKTRFSPAHMISSTQSRNLAIHISSSTDCARASKKLSLWRRNFILAIQTDCRRGRNRVEFSRRSGSAKSSGWRDGDLHRRRVISARPNTGHVRSDTCDAAPAIRCRQNANFC